MTVHMIHIGIAGGGMIVPSFLEACAEVENLAVSAIYARRAEVRQQLASEHRIPLQFADYDAMLTSPEVDAVYVALLNPLHFDFAKRALLAGKSVILEKPFTVTLAQTDALIALAEAKKVVLFEAITNLYHPSFEKIRALLPQLGSIRIVSVNYTQYSSRYDLFRAGKAMPVFTPEAAGGALTDLGIYNIHLVTELFGVPERVIYQPNMERGVDTSGILLLKYPDFSAVCICAKDCKAPTNFTLQGDRGCIFSDLKPNAMGGFTFSPNGGAEVCFPEEEHRPRLYYELKAFADHFEAQDADFFARRLAHTRDAMTVLDLAIRSGGMGYEKTAEC